jgi:hypothetical protein
VEQRLDGSVWLRFRGSYLILTPCPAPRPTLLPPTTLGTGSFYLAKYRNFLLCIDIIIVPSFMTLLRQ